jgi:hypothetical protein
MKVGIIIPCTSFGRDEWGRVQDAYLVTHTFKSFVATADKEHEYIFYIGIDEGDRIYDTEECKEYLGKFCGVMKNINMKVEFIYMTGIEKGYLTKMWNVLFKRAYDDGCDYFFQCGDDIIFKSDGWVNHSISVLELTDGVGLTGPLNNNTRLLTQSFVSRKHMELFGYFFNESIINWGCDDWINKIYKGMGRFYPLKAHFCMNDGGKPRYDVNNKKYKNDIEFNQETKLIIEKANKIADKNLRQLS